MNKRPNRNQVAFSIVPFAVLTIACAKAYVIAQTLVPSAPVPAALDIFLADLPVIGISILIAYLGALASADRGFLSLPVAGAARITLFIFTIGYLIDSVAHVQVDEGLSVEALIKYTSELKEVAQFVSPAPLLMILLVFLASIKTVILPRRTASIACFFGLFTFVSFVFSAPKELRPYRSVFSGGTLFSHRPARAAEKYSATEIDLFRQSGNPLEIKPALIDRQQDVILLVIESLSAIDSHRLWGIENTLPNFDKISEDGLLFKNFFANTRQSEGATIAMFNGISPVPFPGSTYDWYKTFSGFPSVVRGIREMGFQTKVLGGAPTGFLNYGKYLKAVGFESVVGRDENPVLHKAQRFAFESPADEVLYGEVLKEIAAMREEPRPTFLAVFTCSSHLPWTDPRGRKNSEKNVWNYVDDEFGKFYEQLKQTGFLEHGLLIVLGDHRKRELRTIREIKFLGDISRARIPLLLLGAHIPAGQIDERYFQQADLLSKLDRVLDPHAELSPHILFLDDPPADHILIDAQQSSLEGYRIHLDHTEATFEGPAPPGARELMFGIHKQRGMSQQLLESIEKTGLK